MSIRPFMINRLRNSVIILAAILIAVFLSVRPAAAATSTLRGAAWWGNQSDYLYMDCLDDVIGDRLDDPYNLCGGSLGSILICGTAPFVFHFSSAPCGGLIHHVYLNDNGNLSGSAWSYSKGLISFDATTTPPDAYAFNANCPSTCNLTDNCWACYSSSTNQVYGWARVVNDGTWVKLNAATTTPVQLQSWNSAVLPGHGILPGDFVGYATTSADTLSFNCASEPAGACAARTYKKVYIGDLRIGHLSAPNWSFGQACSNSALDASLHWDLNSGTQSGYEVVVNTTNTFSTSSATCWSGVATGTVAQNFDYDQHCGTPLSYHTPYFWWIRLYDQNGSSTPWYQFGTNDTHQGASVDTDTNTPPDGNPQTFTTYKHEFPSPLFSWSPASVLVGTTTSFTSASQYYTTASPSTPQSCSGANCLYVWNTSDTLASIGSSTGATTSIIFAHATGTSVTLNVADADAYACSTSTTLLLNYDLPIWREVKAQ